MLSPQCYEEIINEVFGAKLNIARLDRAVLVPKFGGETGKQGRYQNEDEGHGDRT
jgi:hypothetical protein